MSDQTQWHIRPRYWLLVALTALFVAGLYGAGINRKRARIYEISSCQYEDQPILPCVPKSGVFSAVSKDPDGRTRHSWNDGSYQVGPEGSSGPHGVWQTFDSHGVLRMEEQFEGGRCRGPCRYYDADGRLRVEGNWITNQYRKREGIWTVYDIVGDGPRWIVFFE